MMYQKKSQTAIFMIVGMVIILGGFVFFYYTQKAEPAKSEIRIIQEQIPLEFEPIKKYASSCAYSVGAEGVEIIGRQGGYISFSNRALNREQFAAAQNPTESEAVPFTKNSDLKIPYWWHLKSANVCGADCTFASKKPDLRQTDNSIEKQLERYVDLKFKECLNNFEPFAGQGFKISEAGKIKTDITIGADDITVLVDYPLNVEKNDVKTKLSQFAATVPVGLEKIYSLAEKITNMEIKHRYLEKHVLNLLVAFSGTDKEKLPPMSDMQFRFGSAISWQKSDIKNRITAMLSSYIPLFQVDGTYNYERNVFESELKQRLYDSAIIPAADGRFRNLAANFAYLDFWPVYFDLNCNGEKCMPSSANSLISTLVSTFGIQAYRFAYDLSFPVLVEIDDPFALNGKGYTLSFFLEGNIRNNKPLEAGLAPLERAALSESSLLCDTRTSGNVTLAVASASTKKPVDDAQVLYTVVDESCFIGSTNREGILTERFPVAAGGIVSVAKEGYIGKAVEFDAGLNRDASLNVWLQPVHTKKLIVKKKNVVKTADGWKFVNTPVDLNGKESAAVTLTRINEDGDLEFSSAANYEGQQKEPSEIEIAPGDYAADATLLAGERIVVPEKQECFRKGIFGDEECITIPKVDFGERASAGQEAFPEGGLKINITISPNDLEKHSTIVLYAVSIDLAGLPEQERSVEDIGQMGKIEEYSAIYQLALQPEFQ